MPASGTQWISWIHVADIVGLFLLALDHPDADGPINGTAPLPVRNADFSRALARVLRRPFLPIGPPSAAIRLSLARSLTPSPTASAWFPPDPSTRLPVPFDELAAALAEVFGRQGGMAEGGRGSRNDASKNEDCIMKFQNSFRPGSFPSSVILQ